MSNDINIDNRADIYIYIYKRDSNTITHMSLQQVHSRNITLHDSKYIPLSLVIVIWQYYVYMGIVSSLLNLSLNVSMAYNSERENSAGRETNRQIDQDALSNYDLVKLCCIFISVGFIY